MCLVQICMNSILKSPQCSYTHIAFNHHVFEQSLRLFSSFLSLSADELFTPLLKLHTYICSDEGFAKGVQKIVLMMLENHF